MKLRNIVEIARLELKRKKKTYSATTLIILGGLLVIFFIAASILFTKGVVVQNTYYDVQTQNSRVLGYLEDSKYDVDMTSRNIVRVDGNVVTYRSGRSLKDMASASAFLERLDSENDRKLIELGVNPQFLLYVNVTTLAQSASLNESRNISDLLYRERLNVSQNLSGELGTAPFLDTSVINQNSPIREQSDDRISTETSSWDESEDVTNVQTQTIRIEQTDISQNQALISDVDAEFMTPSQINTFAFVKDLFIFIQILFILNIASGLFGTAILEEKLNQRSSLLFLAHISQWDFILGKVLVYFVSVYILFIGILAMQYPFLLTHVAVYFIGFVLLILYLGMSCLNGLLARNHKEYSFLSVFTITGVSLYLLIPAFLANISELSYASLLTPFALYAQGAFVNNSLLFFVIPIYGIIGLLLFYICSVCWDFESLYAFETPYQKLLLLLSKAMHNVWHGFIFGLSSVAFGWVSQLLLIAVLLSVDVVGKYIFFFIFAAIFEEFFRNMGAYALVKYNHPLLSKKFLFSCFIGLGFMIAEKGFLVLTIAPYLEGFELLVLSGLIAPFMLHTLLTYGYFTLATRYNLFKTNYLLTCILLGLLHAGINLLIISYTGVFLP
jgi:hypothetical protein